MADPTDIVGLARRWRADSIAQVNGTAVASWPALTGGLALAQATGTAQPTYVTGAVNGQPVVRFDGTSDYLTATPVTQSQPVTVSFVVKTSAIPAAGLWAELFDASGVQVIWGNANTIDGWAGFDLMATGQVTTTGYHVLTYLANGAQSRIYWDGTQVAAADSGANGMGADLAVGRLQSGATRFASMDLAEVLVYSRALTTSDLATLDTYYAGQYGLTLADALAVKQGSTTRPTWSVTATAAGSVKHSAATTRPTWSVTAAPAGAAPILAQTATAAWSAAATAAGAKPKTGPAAPCTWSVTTAAAGAKPAVPSHTGSAAARWTAHTSATAAAPKTGAATPTWSVRASGAGLAIPAGWLTVGAGYAGTAAGEAPGSEQNIGQLAAGLPRGWRYLAQRINRDGSPGPWLDTELPLSGVQLTDVLSGPTQLQATITPELQRLIASDGSPLLDEWGTAIYAEADGIIRGGVVLRRSEKNGAVYTIEGAGFSGYPKGMAYEGATQFRNVDPVDVVRHVWDHVQQGQHSNIGMRVDRTTSTPARIGVPETDSSGAAQDKPYELNWWTTSDLGGEIDKLAADTPFDYHEWHEWVTDHSAVIHHLDFGWPLIGRRRDDLRFVLGENIQVMPAVERDGEDYANHVIVLGAGEGSAMVRAEARIDDGRLRRTVTIDAKALTTTAQAQQLARNEVTIRSQLGTITQVVVRDTPGTRIGSWGPGDEIRLMAETDWAEPVDLWFQVVTITYTPDNPDIVTMALARSGHRAAFPSSVDRLAVQIATIQQQIRDLSRAPQLPTSSIDSGALTVTTPGADGNPQTTVIVGQQFDGTSGAVTVAGPRPPTPTAPNFTAVVGGVEVTWPGTFTDPQAGYSSPVVAPMDFAYMSVEVSADPTFIRETKQAAILSAAGGTVTLAWTPINTPLYARLITVSSAGKYSLPSGLSGPVDSGPVGFGDLGFSIAQYAGGTTIYYGDGTPTQPPEGFTPGDMWLQDTGETGGSGQPLYLLYRWDGIAWRLLQDQGVAQSVAQAISAQAAADTATVTASQASALAAAAQDLAATKITTWYQPAAPTSGQVTGDLWLDTSNGNKLYRWSGSAWVAVQDAALQQALTTAGTAQATADRKVQSFDRATAPTNPADDLGVGDLWIDTGHGNKLYRWSGTAWVAYQDTAIQTALSSALTAQNTANAKITSFYTATAPTTGMTVGDFWLDPSNGNKLYRYSGSAWVAVQDTQIQTALTNAATAQSTADGKVRIFAQTTAPTGMTTGDVGDMWIDTDDGNKLYTWSGTAWTARQLGNSAITPNSLIASNVIATGTVTAALLETMLVLATTVIAGNVGGEHSAVSSSGIQAYANDPSDGLPTLIGQFGRGWSVRNPTTGAVTASVTDLGDLTARSLSTSDGDPEFGGVRLMSNTLWNRPWGLVGWAQFPQATGFSGSTSGEIPVWEVAFKAQPGRAYRLCSTPLELAADVGSKAYIRSRRTTDGSTPTVSSPVWTEQFVAALDTGWGPGLPMQFLMWGPQLGHAAETWRILVTIAAAGGSTIKMWREQFEYFWVEDIGPLPPDIGQANGAVTAKSTVTSTYNATWSRSWKAGGTAVSFDDPMYQGYGDSFNGRQTSAAGFADVTGVLSGAAVNKVELWLFAEHWWNMSGGTARLHYHGQTTEPASSPAMTYMTDVAYTARGQGQWIDITAWASQVASGAFRGVGLVAPDNTAPYYGRFSGASGGTSGLPPQLRLTYTR